MHKCKINILKNMDCNNKFEQFFKKSSDIQQQSCFRGMLDIGKQYICPSMPSKSTKIEEQPLNEWFAQQCGSRNKQCWKNSGNIGNYNCSRKGSRGGGGNGGGSGNCTKRIVYTATGDLAKVDPICGSGTGSGTRGGGTDASCKRKFNPNRQYSDSINEIPVYFTDVSQSVAGRPIIGATDNATNNQLPQNINYPSSDLGCFQPKWLPKCV